MPNPAVLAPWLLEQEARALLRRLDRVRAFALVEPMVQAASPGPAAMVAIERYLMTGRRKLRGEVREFVRWIRGPGKSVPPEQQQRRLTLLRLSFHTSLAQLDTFADALSQRSETETGVWLAGLDVAAQDALALPQPWLNPPEVICYLDRGMGGAIRRARTRLPGGGENPVAVIRIPRERMIGFGIASSLAHEVGHQGAALLDLIASLRKMLQQAQAAAPAEDRRAWAYWERTISEVVADFWAVAKVGIASTLGLISVVSLPRRFVFRMNLDDPHPFPWIRVRLSCAIGEALYPHRQWREMAATWDALYPVRGLDAGRRQTIELLLRTMPAFVKAMVEHRPAALRGISLGAALADPGRAPARLSLTHVRWRADPQLMRQASPTLVFAVLGRARVNGKLTPEDEDQFLGGLITHWALKDSLDTAARFRSRARPTVAPQQFAVAPRDSGLVAVG